VRRRLSESDAPSGPPLEEKALRRGHAEHDAAVKGWQRDGLADDHWGACGISSREARDHWHEVRPGGPTTLAAA
jgi:hypothetical protein